LDRISEMEIDVSGYLGCFPSFDEMEFFEFMQKYGIIKEKANKKKATKMMDFAEGFRKGMLGTPGNK